MLHHVNFSVPIKAAGGYDPRIHSFIKHSRVLKIKDRMDFHGRWLERSVHDLAVVGGTENVNNVLKDGKLTSVCGARSGHQ